MMCKIVEHFITGLQQDCEHLKEQRDLSVFDSEARKKKEVKLYQQLSELIETERKYVQDLEQVSTRGRRVWSGVELIFLRSAPTILRCLE